MQGPKTQGANMMTITLFTPGFSTFQLEGVLA